MTLHRLEMEEYERAMAEWKATDREDRGQAPEKPAPARCFAVSDPTVQALAEALELNPHGLLMARDELDGWFQCFTRFSGAGATDRPQWLELHSGGTLLIKRKTGERPTIAVRRAACSVAGTIQPKVLARALDQDAMQSGLAARFLMAMPPRRKRVWNENETPEDLVGRYQDLLRALLDLHLADEAKRKPHVLRLSDAAKRLFTAFYDEWGEVQHAAEGKQASAFAKIEAYSPRLMLVHHVAAHAAAGTDGLGPVTEASARAGIGLARWFAYEATRVYAMLAESEEERDARRLVEFIEARGGRITVRQLQRANGRKYPTSESADAALNALAQSGRARWLDRPGTPQGGNPARVLELCPTPEAPGPGFEGEDDEAPSPADPPMPPSPRSDASVEGSGDGDPRE